MRVAIYARYSTELQRDASIEDQIRVCEARAEREGWEVVNRYTDHASTGSNLMRPGVQMLMQDAMQEGFDLVLAEALDRLSRDQEDIAHIYKRLTFNGIKLITLSDGEIGELHVGLKGTMGALFLKDLADKTRRGLRGRVENGKSGGGICYGYDVAHKLDGNGNVERGDRTINPAQASVVERIFKDYVAGRSPKAIAFALNEEGVPGPTGRGWTQSTINGNRQRGTGILNNELYVGTLVWNRQRFIKNPDTGKRVARLNPSDEWVYEDVSKLRIVPQDLWDEVKARQERYTQKRTEFNKSKRPKYLLSGLLRCGCCGGGFSKVSQTHYGCSTARNRGTCDNRQTIAQDKLEARVLVVMHDYLMDSKLCGEFCDEYTKHINAVRQERNALVESYKQELAKLDRDQEKVLDAICNGIDPKRVKDRMNAMAAREREVRRLLEVTQEAPVLMHPNMALRYKEAIADIVQMMGDEERRHEASEILRTLIDKIVLSPSNSGDGLEVDLIGALAGILTIAHGHLPVGQKRKTSGSSDRSKLPDVSAVQLVAGAGFEPATFRL